MSKLIHLGVLTLVVTMAIVSINGENRTLAAQNSLIDENGELAASADGMTFIAILTGDQEVPNPVPTDTTGFAVLRIPSNANAAPFALRVNDGLAVTQAHIHCGAPGENGPVVAFLAGFHENGWNVNGWWVVNTSLTDANIVDVSCGTNLQELAAAARQNMAYVNVHTVANPGGEVRGQLFVLPLVSEIGDFSLEDLFIKTGTTVRWTNTGVFPHTSTSGFPGNPSGDWESGILSPGESFTHTFNQAGVFPYYCRIHPALMQATVTVED